MSDLLPPFHKVMSDSLECHIANDRVALLEMELAERDKLLADERAQFVKGRGCYSQGSCGWNSWQSAIRELDQVRARAGKGGRE